MGLSYRARQFFQALKASPSLVDIDQVQRILSPALVDLFLRMELSDQAHSIQVMQKLQKEGHTHPDLLSAALLHDVGKCLYPLHVWERVMIVVAKAIFPGQVSRWGQAKARGWKRAFVVAEQHPIWGAELAERAGANPTTIQLIRRHQDAQSISTHSYGDQLLFQLQLADDES
jgi:putative nucleotidyltransferase with HDIG domain